MRIGLVTAMPIELDYLLKHITITEERKLNRNTFYVGNYGEFELVLVTSGVGKSNAVAYTQMLIDYYKPDCLFNLGIAGGLKNGIKPMDIIVGSHYSHHDVNITQMKELFPYREKFETNQLLVDFVSKSMSNSIVGGIVSGEQFIGNDQQKQEIIKAFGAVAVDMESSAIAHVSFINNVPFVAIRGISDLADDSAHDTYNINEQQVSDHVGKTFLEMIGEKDFTKSIK